MRPITMTLRVDKDYSASSEETNEHVRFSPSVQRRLIKALQDETLPAQVRMSVEKNASGFYTAYFKVI